MTVPGMKSSTHHAGREVRNRKLHNATLELVTDFFVRHDEDATGAVGKIEQRTFEWPPLIAADPQQFSWRPVHVVGNPDERLLHVGVGAALRTFISPHIAVET